MNNGRYGLPYKGSKNAIAEWVVNQLPAANTFCDLFFGGGAITHRAMLTGKYQNFIANDIDARLPVFFRDCVQGFYTLESKPHFVTRQQFTVRRFTDAYTALIWSFGNNGRDYVYGKDIQDFKYAYHLMVYQNDVRHLHRFGYSLQKSTETDIYARYLDYQKQLKAVASRKEQELERIERLANLERVSQLECLRNIKCDESFTTYGGDYQKVPIPDGALIYCDIPYKGTDCGKYGGFDHDRFYEWADKQSNIYISEYEMPEGFIEVANIEKHILSDKNDNSRKAVEKIFTNERTYFEMPESQKEIVKHSTAKQISLFDL